MTAGAAVKIPAQRSAPAYRARLDLLAPLPRLSARMLRVLVEGDVDQRYNTWSLQRGGSDSEHGHAVTYALVCWAVRVGADYPAFRDLLMEHPGHGADHVRRFLGRKGWARTDQYLRRLWWARQQQIAGSDGIASRQDAHADLAALRSKVETAAWRGTAGKTDLKNLIFRLGICDVVGGREHTLSERHLAEGIGCSQKAARRSNSRLKTAGLLWQVDHGSTTEGASWYLLTGTDSHNDPTPQVPKAGGDLSEVTVRNTRSADLDSRAAAQVMAADAFAHLGLGGSGLAVLAALAADDGQTVADLQGSASVSQATAYRRVAQLTEMGLVIREGELYRLTEQALDGIGEESGDCTDPVIGWEDTAQRLGTAGTGERRRARHEAQRRRRDEQIAAAQEKRRTATREVHPALVPTEFVAADGQLIDPETGEVIDGWSVDTEGRWISHDDMDMAA